MTGFILHAEISTRLALWYRLIAGASNGPPAEY